MWKNCNGPRFKYLTIVAWVIMSSLASVMMLMGASSQNMDDSLANSQTIIVDVETNDVIVGTLYKKTPPLLVPEKIVPIQL